MNAFEISQVDSSTPPRVPGPTALVTGFYGVPNVGDSAVCRAVVAGLRAQGFGRPVVVTKSARVSCAFTRVDADLVEGFFPSVYFWLRVGTHLRKAMTADLIVVGGGGILQDVHSWTTIPTHLLPASLGIVCGKPAVTVGVGVGPIRRKWLRMLVGAVCSRMPVVQVRDEASREVLAACGVPRDRVTVTADVVPYLDLRGAYPRPKREGKPLARVGLALRRWPGLDEQGVADLVDALASQDVRVDMLCYEPQIDEAFCESVLAKCTPAGRANAAIRVPASLDDAIEAVGNVDALVSMRLHGCIFAAYLGVPFLAIPYDEKVRMFASQIGATEDLRPLSEVRAPLAGQLAGLVRAYPAKQKARQQGLEAVRGKACENFVPLRGAIDQPPSAAAQLAVFPWFVLLLVAGALAEAAHVVEYLTRNLFHARRGARPLECRAPSRVETRPGGGPSAPSSQAGAADAGILPPSHWPVWCYRSDYARVSDLSDPNLPAWLAPLEKEQAVFLARLAPEESQWRLRWPRDSLHQWSRPWECMYVASAAPPAPARILDAGAGFGFFPYYWASLGYKVDAVDCDRRLGAHHARARTAFAALKEGVPGPRGEVVFDVQDLRSLSFADSTFDMVYSVSVLEHIATDRKSVLRELARVVKPGGVVVITCDLSLDAQSEIKMVPFLTLLSEVESVFEYAVEPVFRFGPDVLTTDSVRYRSPERLPWRPPPFRPVWLLNPLFYLKHRRYSEADFYSLAVVGMKLRKKV